MAKDYQLALPDLPPSAQKEQKRSFNRKRSLNEADFFTIGYSGQTTPAFLQLLREAEVLTVVDIRFHAFSLYKPDFNASRLTTLLADEGIDYVHVPELGVPRDIRAKAIGRKTRRAIWAWYEANVVKPHVTRNLNWFFNIGDHPLALMCTELDPTSCHRHVLAEALEKLGLRSFDL